jgi:hypothetical protein
MFSHKRFKGSAVSGQHQLDQCKVILAACAGDLGVFAHLQT